jgi:hypothetical protein
VGKISIPYLDDIFLLSTLEFSKYFNYEVGRNIILGFNPRKVMAKLQLKGN